jgi:hypothetical protein
MVGCGGCRSICDWKGAPLLHWSALNLPHCRAAPVSTENAQLANEVDTYRNRPSDYSFQLLRTTYQHLHATASARELRYTLCSSGSWLNRACTCAFALWLISLERTFVSSRNFMMEDPSVDRMTVQELPLSRYRASYAVLISMKRQAPCCTDQKNQERPQVFHVLLLPTEFLIQQG